MLLQLVVLKIIRRLDGRQKMADYHSFDVNVRACKRHVTWWREGLLTALEGEDERERGRKVGYRMVYQGSDRTVLAFSRVGRRLRRFRASLRQGVKKQADQPTMHVQVFYS